MHDLQKHLDRLISFFPGWSEQPLSWSCVLFAEAMNIKFGKVIQIPRSALATPEQYAAQFDKHLNAGHGWINMNAAGILDETLLVIIELPSYVNTVPRDKVSVNFSGPNMRRWDVSGYIKIID